MYIVKGFVRNKGERNPMKWGLRLDESCLDGTIAATLADLPMKEEEKRAKREKEQEQAWLKCAIM